VSSFFLGTNDFLDYWSWWEC